MTISFTIENENENDWFLLLNSIDKNVSWNDKITNTLKQCINDIQSEYYKNNNIYGIYDIQIDNTTYINLIIKCRNTDIMVCDYPKQTINKTMSSNYWKYITIGILTVTIIGSVLYTYI